MQTVMGNLVLQGLKLNIIVKWSAFLLLIWVVLCLNSAWRVTILTIIAVVLHDCRMTLQNFYSTVQLPHFCTDAHLMVHLCSSHYSPAQVIFPLHQFSNPLSLLMVTNRFCSHNFLTSPFSYSTQILWTSQSHYFSFRLPSILFCNSAVP
jgi:hypothetical protein